MAQYKTIRYGSRGDEVKRLQTLLNQQGSNLAVDGIYGEKTRSAVKQYEKSKGLAVDGIVGVNTWTSLAGSHPGQVDINAGSDLAGSGNASSGAQSRAVKLYEQNRPEYAPSDALTQAEKQLAQYEANKPGEYVSPYQQKIDSLYNEILNRGEFSYDPQADPLYERYKDRYVSGGQLAMQDAMAQAAALSGGYANSYAQQAGQQQMGAYMTALADVIPELEARAYGRWQDAGQKLYNDLGLTQRRR